jgi:hypothetical protein
MSDQPTVSAANATPGSPTVVHPTYPLPRTWKVAMGVAIVMVVLAMIGVGLTTTNRAAAPKYWLSLVPVYGLLCVAVAWFRKRHGAKGRLIVQQVLHWLIIAAAIWLDFYVRSTGEMTGEAAGLNAMLLLSVGCLLAGVHLEWMFAVVGVLLAITLMLAVKAEQYLWLAFVIGAILVAAMFGVMRVRARSKRTATEGQLVVGSRTSSHDSDVRGPPAMGPQK